MPREPEVRTGSPRSWSGGRGPVPAAPWGAPSPSPSPRAPGDFSGLAICLPAPHGPWQARSPGLSRCTPQHFTSAPE